MRTQTTRLQADIRAVEGRRQCGVDGCVTVRTVYADGRPVATQVAMTVQGRIDDQFGYQLRLISSRWGSAYGFFTSDSGRVTADCDGDRVNLQMNADAGLGATCCRGSTGRTLRRLCGSPSGGDVEGAHRNNGGAWA